jgi:hypothetical protein
MNKKVGVCFSKEIGPPDPLSHIGKKRPVYLELLDRINNQGWNAYVLTRRTYLGDGLFDGVWCYQHGKFKIQKSKVKIDLVYDRTGGINFPPENDQLNVINNREFKLLAWDKYATYQEIGEYMPRTVWVGDLCDKFVLKPFNGLKGEGVLIGEVSKPGKYIFQEFVDTSKGLPGIVKGMHDLRVVIINGKVVWCHVREPHPGKLLANAAQGGKLTEVDYAKAAESIKEIVSIISKKFYEKYDNPVYSLDFGMGADGVPKIFEINDQIGFPLPEMKNKDKFLEELILNFKSKIN